MSNPFEKFGIRHLSPSSLNKWRSSPGLWALSYLGGFREPGNESMWRGSAVEAGLAVWMETNDLEAANKAALVRFMDDGGNEGDEMDCLAPMLDQAIIEFGKISAKLSATQIKVEHYFDGVEVPVIGYCDFIFEDGSIFDLKTANRMPDKGQAKPDHGRQAALYSVARNAPSSLVYVTTKKAVTIPVGGNERVTMIDEMRRDAESLRRYLALHDTAESAILSLPMNSDDWKWKSSATDKINQIYMEARV